MCSTDNKNQLLFSPTNGILASATIKDLLRMEQEQSIIDNHNHKIWMGTDDEWYTYLDDDSARGYSKKHRKTYEELKQVIVDYYETRPTFGKVFEQWMKERLEYGEITLQSHTRYQNDYKRFVHGEPIESKEIQAITRGELTAFIKRQIKDKHLTVKAYAGLRTVIRGTFMYAKDCGYSDFDASTFFAELYLPRTMFQKKIKVKEDEVFSDDEAALLKNYLRKSDSIVDQGLLLLFDVGLRIGELVALDKDSLTLVSDNKLKVTKTEIQYRDPETGQCKREVRDFPKTDAGYREVIITDDTVRLIRKILILGHHGDYLFENKQGQRMKSSTFQLHLRQACLKLGITPKSPHKIRKTYGSVLLDGDVDDILVAEQMGHTNVSTTEKYYYYSHKNDEKKKTQIDKALAVANS